MSQSELEGSFILTKACGKNRKISRINFDFIMVLKSKWPLVRGFNCSS